MTSSDITVYGAHWCPDCRTSKQFLGEHQIPYQWIDIEEDPAAEQFVIEKNKGKRIIPTIRFIQDKVLSHPKIEVRWHTEVQAFEGVGAKLQKLKVFNNQTGELGELPADGAFIFIGLVPNTSFLQGSGIQTDPWGFVVTGHALVHSGRRPDGFERRDPHRMETSIPGIFAAGDVRDTSTKQVVSAAGEGGSAALEIREYLKMV